MTWHRTASQWFNLPADALWGVLADLRRWPDWNPAVAEASLDGSLAEGAMGRYAPSHRVVGLLHRRTAPGFTVAQLDPGHSIVLRQPQPGGGQDIAWSLEERDGGTVFTQRVTLDGPLAQQFGLTAGEPLVRGFAAQCARLYRLAAPASPIATPDGAPSGPLTVIAGGTGSLGTALASELVCSGHDVALLTRSFKKSPFRQILWDGRGQGEWSDELGARGRLNIVNLAGVSLDRPGTPENIAMLAATRVEPTRALVTASRSWNQPVERWVQQSAVGIYGDSPEPMDETAVPPADAPGLAGVVRDWEAGFDGAAAAHSIVLRTGVVLERDAAILARLTVPARLGAGGALGTGAQWFSWIHIADWLRVVRAALGLPLSAGERPLELPDGVVNATSPHPVQNRELMAHVREYVGVPVGIPAPAPLLRAAAAVLRTNPQLALESVRAVPGVLTAAGFEFHYPQLAAAFREMAA
ncbi:DUF1731 domain-containing protein [Sinomonas sp. ASV486]|uniref:DUF1731 domain-containing protein n=1 Tax=Sinomonas sp. ASV486 TaxID=3051170 RepID=UPI0027DBEAE8|nr:DUF1731 domain-containing protein [Sinomonas sp. ASV486]MDQ4489842.1 DUF1731 domain-containing protein [Sinomonas sp. ASV486]